MRTDASDSCFRLWWLWEEREIDKMRGQVKLYHFIAARLSLTSSPFAYQCHSTHSAAICCQFYILQTKRSTHESRDARPISTRDSGALAKSPCSHCRSSVQFERYPRNSLHEPTVPRGQRSLASRQRRSPRGRQSALTEGCLPTKNLEFH